MFTKANIITIGILAAVLIFVGLFVFKDQILGTTELNDIEEVRKGNKEVTYTDLNQNPVDIKEYAGRVLVINSWATWCPFCTQELKDFVALKNEFGDQIHVLAINRSEEPTTARVFVERAGGEQGLVYLLDPDDVFYRSVGGFSMPETVFYDREGNIAVHKRGFMDLSEMRKHTEKALNSTPK